MTQTQWWQCGKIHRLVDGAGNITDWTRDMQGRVARKTYADGSHEDYAYDFSGRLETESDGADEDAPIRARRPPDEARLLRRGDARCYVYLLNPWFPRIATRVDGVGTTSYAYNPLDSTTLGAGQVARINGPFVDDTLKLSYDELGRTKKLEVVDDATFSTASLSELDL